MSEFNFDAFRPVRPVTDTEQKRESVSAASAAKRALLEAGKAQADESWSGKLGLESGSFLGNRVNDAASLVSGGSRLVGDLITLPVNAVATAATLNSTRDDYDAYRRVQQGSTDSYDLSRAEAFQTAEKARGVAGDIRETFDLSGIVDQTNRNSLTSALGSEFESNWTKVTSGWEDGKPSDVVSGVAGLLMNAGEAVVTNPSAAREYIIENAPQLFVGGVAGKVGKTVLGASNVGYAADTYRQGLEKYAAENGGALPPEAERNRMALYAASLAAAEQVGDVVSLGVAKVAGKTATESAKSGVLASLKNTLKAGAEAGATEAATEGYQTFAEGEVKGEPASAQDIYTGAVIGGVAGAGLAGGGRAVAEAMKATPEHAAQREVEAAAEAEAAVPAQEIAAIEETIKDASPEQVKESLKQAGAIVSDLEAYKNKLEAVPETIKEARQELAELEAELKTFDPNTDDPAEVDFIESVQERMTELNETLAELDGDDKLLGRQNELTKVNRQLEQARENYHGLVGKTQPAMSKAEVNDTIRAANSNDIEVSSKAGQVLLNLSMAAPDDLDPAIIDSLVKNAKNGLTTDQRDLLRKFTEARTAELAVKKQSEVSQEILFGQKQKGGNIGIAQYRTRIAAAVASENRESADRNLALLGAFAASHAAKINAIAKADVGDQIIRQGNDWVVNTGKRLSDKQRRENGAVNVHENSGKLIAEIRNEAKALAAAHAQLSAAVALHFDGSAVQSVPSPAATPSPENISSKKMVKVEARLNDKPVQTVGGKQQNQKNVSDKKDNIQSKSSSLPSPQSQPASPIAADAAQATAAPSARPEATTQQAQPEATQQQAAVSEANPAPVAEVATAEEQDQNIEVTNQTGLTLFKERVKDIGTDLHSKFTGLNLIAQFMKQDPVSERYKQQRPLVAVKDFMSAWKNKQPGAMPNDFLTNKVSTDRNQEDPKRTALTHFYKTVGPMINVLKKSLVKSDVDANYKSRDMSQFLFDKDGNLEQNILTAMAYAGYVWALDQVNSPARKTKEQLNEMHGQDKDFVLTDEAHELLQGVVAVEDLVHAELGKSALDALGFKATADAPLDLMPKLQSAMGVHIMAMLEQSGFLERQHIHTDLVTEYFSNDQNYAAVQREIAEDTNKPMKDRRHKAMTTYVKFKRNADFSLTPKAEDLQVSNAGSGGVVEKLFGVERAPRMAQTMPMDFDQELAQRSMQEVPEAQREVLKATANTPHKIIPAMWSMLEALGHDALLKIAGHVDPETVHKKNRSGVQAQNDNLANQLSLMLEMMGYKAGGAIDFDTEYFVIPNVWKNYRAGFLTRSLDQQTSKIHRYMFSQPNWTATIDRTKPEHMMEFLISVGMNLGVKTDKTPNIDTIDKIMAKLAEPDMEAAIEAVRAQMFDGAGMTPVQVELVTKVAQGEGMVALQAMTAYATYLQAIVDKRDTFDVTMLVGADGKTNGPILTHLSLGAASSIDGLASIMERGGMYTNEDGKPTHFSEWYKDPANQDLYEDLASHITKSLSKRERTQEEIQALHKAKQHKEAYSYFTKEQRDAVEMVTGQLEKDGKVASAGRNLVKTPLTAFAFGSALIGSIKSMENKFIETIYEQFTDIVAESKNPVPMIKALNVLIKKGNGKIKDLIPENTHIDSLLDYELSAEHEAAIRAAFMSIVGNTVQYTMDTYFSVFQQRRSSLNMAFQAGFAMYDAAYQNARTKLMDSALNGDTGEVAYFIGKSKKHAGKRVAMHDLTGKHEAKLRKQLKALMPVAHTAYSKAEGNLNAGLMMAKSDTSVTSDPIYTSSVQLGTPIMNALGEESNKVQSKAMTYRMVNPGVAGTPYMTHSSDSANMHLGPLKKVANTLNVHDEASNGVLHIAEAARAINQATAENFLRHSPFREAVEMLERQMIEMASQINSGKLDKDAVIPMAAAWKISMEKYIGDDVVFTPEEAMDMLPDTILSTYLMADETRLGFLSKLNAMDQYTWEGGQFIVDEDFHKEVAAELKAMKKGYSARAKHALEFLAKTVKEVVEANPEQMTEALKAAGYDVIETVPTAEAGAIDTATVAEALNVPVSAEAVNELAPEVRAEVIQKTAEAVDKLDGFGLNPWGEVGPTDMVDADIKAAFEKQPEMNRDQIVAVLMKSVNGAQAALLQQAAKVLPANLKVTVVTPDTPVDAVLEKPLTNSRGWFVPTTDNQNEIYVLSADFRYSGLNAETLVHELVHAALAREIHNPSSKASQSIVSDLEALLEHVKAQPGAKEFTDATKDVHELVSWGMTNAKFQKFLAVTNYSKSKTERNRLVTAMKAFTNTITKLLFGSVNDTKERALSVLIHNTAGLFAQASQPRQGVMNKVLSHAVPAQDYTTADIYEALGQNANNPLSQQDDARLRSLMATMVEAFSPIYGAFGKDAMTKQTMGAASVYANAVAGGTAPFAADATANGMAGNEQVAFMLEQVEVTMRAVLSGADGVTSIAYRELTKLYEEARTELKGKLTDDEYNFVFSFNSGADNQSDYLSRFAALGLVHPTVNAALQFNTSRKADDEVSESFIGRLQQIFEQAIEWVVGRWTKTNAGQRADSKLEALAAQLVMIEAKRRARLNVQQSKTIESIEEAFRGVAEGARDKIDEWANGPFFKQSKNGFVRLAGSMTSTVVKDRLDQLGLAYQEFSDQHFHHSHGMFAGIVNELRGANAGNTVFYKLLRMTKFLEGQRKDLITGTSKIAIQSFANKGKDLTDSMKKSISNVFLRTDMSALLDRYPTMDGLAKLLADKSEQSKAIAELTEKLAESRHQVYYLNAADALGYQMATGRARTANNVQNAYAISRLFGTDNTAQVTPEQAVKYEPIIDQLASLYALTYTDASAVAEAGKVLQSELAREDKGNGVELVLKLHKQLQTESKARLFAEQEALMMKGYTPEIYNPYIEVQVVGKDDVAEMTEQGFGKGMQLPVADADPEKAEHFLMARHGSGLQQHITGTMSLTAMKAKGTRKHDGNIDLFSKQGQYNVVMMVNINKRLKNDVDAMFKKRIDPSKVDATYLVPVLNPLGEKVNYRYMMENNTKDKVLDRDNRFDKLLGMMAGGIFDKQSSPKQNRTVVEALHEQYKLEGTKKPKSFIEVGPRSPDPEMREIYRLLPESTKQAIREVWKTDTMRVRIDLLDINFGYRKLSMADLLKNDRDVRTGFNKLMGDIVSFVFTGKVLSPHADQEDFAKRDAKATVRIRNTEEVWQTLVREAKDILVVKSVSTLIGNMMSNFTLLYGYGVPMVDVLRSHRIAFRGAVSYKRDSDELFTLQTRLDTGTSGNEVEDRKRVVQLKDSMARNPVRELIEAGLMPTIVEDVELDDDIYSFKSKFVKRMEGYADQVNPGVKAVAKQVYMTHDTTTYKALSQAAQLSDFLGRYTLYQHLTTRKRDPMSKDEAIQLASDAFVNYDVPTHRKMQYMNDMGFFRFTKYYLRIQKVIMHLYRENPGRMLALMGMTSYFDSVPTLLDSNMISRLGNPLEAGAFTYVDAPENLATMKLMQMPFR